ncbi:hypothetical protein GCM10007972_08220 [Iodidimonas muriae]|uniref:Uncharacterized protein n=1 Tax=Iodidimonas muriae TaxID=261467 RepID=A0ABQ2LA47_9PROT|nr:hypothetical protein GCM10007972_08220 [Iodidimonas muriae]
MKTDKRDIPHPPCEAIRRNRPLKGIVGAFYKGKASPNGRGFVIGLNVGGLRGSIKRRVYTGL